MPIRLLIAASLLKTDEDGQFYWETDLDSGGGVDPVYSTAVYTMILALP